MFSYHIANHESAATSYAVKVTIVENGKSRLLEQDDLTLPNGDDRDITIRFSTPKAGTNIEIIVSLSNSGQSIHFRSKS